MNILNPVNSDFTDEELRTEKLRNVPKLIQLVSADAGIQTQAVWLRIYTLKHWVERLINLFLKIDQVQNKDTVLVLTKESNQVQRGREASIDGDFDTESTWMWVRKILGGRVGKGLDHEEETCQGYWNLKPWRIRLGLIHNEVSYEE